MKLYTIYTVSALSVAILASTGCANADSPATPSIIQTENISGQAPNGYQKMGANIRFTDSYDGKSQPGDIENITVTLNSPVTQGTLRLRLSVDEGLTFYSPAQELEFDLAQGPEHSFDVQIGMPSSGKYHLNMLGFTEDVNGHVMSRAGAIAFYVGDSSLNKTEPARGQAPIANGGIKVMDAEETIRPASR